MEMNPLDEQSWTLVANKAPATLLTEVRGVLAKPQLWDIRPHPWYLQLDAGSLVVPALSNPCRGPWEARREAELVFSGLWQMDIWSFWVDLCHISLATSMVGTAVKPGHRNCSQIMVGFYLVNGDPEVLSNDYFQLGQLTLVWNMVKITLIAT